MSLLLLSSSLLSLCCLLAFNFFSFTQPLHTENSFQSLPLVTVLVVVVLDELFLPRYGMYDTYGSYLGRGGTSVACRESREPLRSRASSVVISHWSSVISGPGLITSTKATKSCRALDPPLVGVGLVSSS